MNIYSQSINFFPTNEFQFLDINPVNSSNESGQATVEFVLLLASVVIISLLFMKGIHNGISNYWLSMAQLILDDPTQQLQFQ